MLTATLDLAIGGYQRWVSPRKGYACAYRVCRGRESCSAYGRRVLRRYGAVAWWRLQRRRFVKCRAAAAAMPAASCVSPNPAEVSSAEREARGEAVPSRGCGAGACFEPGDLVTHCGCPTRAEVEAQRGNEWGFREWVRRIGQYLAGCC